jgi:hypothetical protein
MALSGLDAALWDALALAVGLPLATFLGAKPKPIPAYNSSGLGLMSPEAAADEAEKLLAGGFLSVKLRLGHPNLEQDLAVTRAVRKRPRTRSGPSGHWTHVEIGSREGSVAGPLISHLASAVSRCPHGFASDQTSLTHRARCHLFIPRSTNCAPSRLAARPSSLRN